MASNASPPPSPKKLRAQAQELNRLLKSGDPTAAARFAAVWHGQQRPGLNRCLHVIAREAGWPDWESLLAAHTASTPTSVDSGSARISLGDIANDLRSPRGVLVTGRSGTGKTTVLMELVSALLLSAQRPVIFAALRDQWGTVTLSRVDRDGTVEILTTVAAVATMPQDPIGVLRDALPTLRGIPPAVVCIDEAAPRLANPDTAHRASATVDDPDVDDPDSRYRTYRTQREVAIQDTRALLDAIHAMGHALVVSTQEPDAFPGMLAWPQTTVIMGRLILPDHYACLGIPVPAEQLPNGTFRVLRYAHGGAPTSTASLDRPSARNLTSPNPLLSYCGMNLQSVIIDKGHSFRPLMGMLGKDSTQFHPDYRLMSTSNDDASTGSAPPPATS